MSDKDLALTATAKLDQMKAIAFQHLDELDENQTGFIAELFEAGQIDWQKTLKSLDKSGRFSTLQLMHVLAEVTFMDYCVNVIRDDERTNKGE